MCFTAIFANAKPPHIAVKHASTPTLLPRTAAVFSSLTTPPPAQDIHNTLLALASLPTITPAAASVCASASALLNTLPTHTPTLVRLQAALSGPDPADALAAVLDGAGAGNPTACSSARLLYVLQCLAALLTPCCPPQLVLQSVQTPPHHTLVFLSTSCPHVVLRRALAMIHALQAEAAQPQLLAVVTTALALVSGMLHRGCSLLHASSAGGGGVAVGDAGQAATQLEPPLTEAVQGPDTQPADVVEAVDAGDMVEMDEAVLALIGGVMQQGPALRVEVLRALLDLAGVLGKLAGKVCLGGRFNAPCHTKTYCTLPHKNTHPGH